MARHRLGSSAQKQEEADDIVSGFLPVASKISVAFERMAAAERLIIEYKRAHPDKSQELHGAFRWLCPSELLQGKDGKVYEHHAREILQRVMQGGDVFEPTAAECLCMLLGAALKAPLNSTGSALADKLFAQVFGSAVQGKPAREPYPGACEELLIDVRRACQKYTRQVRCAS